MYPLLKKFLPPTIATIGTALCYTGLILMIFALWNAGRAGFRYLQI
jgi:hypothetical protein